MRLRWIGLVLASVLATLTASAQNARSDLNLVVAMDCSWSVNGAEFALQIGGIASAFSDPFIIKAIEDGRYGRINVLLVQWSESGRQAIALPWTTISNGSDAIRYASQVISTDRKMAAGGTSIVGALRFSQEAFASAPGDAERNIIDVIVDGENNQGGRVEDMRDAVISTGTVINALGVVNEVSYLHHYLRNRVIGGQSAFVEKAADYRDFSRAFARKLLREIKGQHFSSLTERDYARLQSSKTLR